jgi:hypothetical protein
MAKPRRYDSLKASKAIGLRIRALREARGWTLEECEEHGWPQWTHLQRIEAGKNMRIDTLIKVANLFGVHPADLLKDI